MQCDTPRIKRWERFNLIHNALEKTFEGRWGKGMIRQANNQAFTLGPTHNLKHI
jgi:hypothetical protein